MSLTSAINVSDCRIINSPGVYNLVNDILINSSTTGACININSSNVYFNGNGNGIDGRWSMGQFIINVAGGITNVTVQNTNLMNARGGIYTSAIGVKIYNNTLNQFNNVAVGIYYSRGANVTGNQIINSFHAVEDIFSLNSSVYNNTVLSSSYGFYSSGSNGTRVINNIISGSKIYAVYLISSSNGLYQGNNGLGNIGTIYQDAASLNNQFINNSFISSGCFVINNPGYYNISQDVSDALEVWGGACVYIRSSNVVLDGNGHTIDKGSRSTSYGISLEGGVSNVTIRNLTLVNFGIIGGMMSNANFNYTLVGINLTNINITGTNEAVRLQFTRNSFIAKSSFSNNSVGIFIANSHNNLLELNSFNRNLFKDISIQGSDNIGNSTNNIAQKNYFTNGNVSIDTYRAVGSKFINNTFRNSYLAAISISNFSFNNLVQYNNISYTHNIAVFIASGSCGNIIDGNFGRMNSYNIYPDIPACTNIYSNNDKMVGISSPTDTDNNWTIEADEFTLYNRKFKLQEAWFIPPSPPSPNFYTRALFILKRGGSYEYNQSAICPLCWVPKL